MFFVEPGNLAGVRLGDFGVARVHASSLTTTPTSAADDDNLFTSRVGTVAYMAPELFKGRYDERAPSKLRH